jgi:hypothetical protein
MVGIDRVLSIGHSLETKFYHEKAIASVVNLKDPKSYYILLQAVVIPIFLAGFVIFIPLGTDGNDTSLVINSWNYICFQITYNLVAYNCMVRPLSIPLRRVLPSVYVWVLLPLIGVVGIFLVYYFCVEYGDGQPPQIQSSFVLFGVSTQVSYLPVFGITYLFVCIWVSYLIGSVIMHRQTIRQQNARSHAKVIKSPVEIENTEPSALSSPDRCLSNNVELTPAVLEDLRDAEEPDAYNQPITNPVQSMNESFTLQSGCPHNSQSDPRPTYTIRGTDTEYRSSRATVIHHVNYLDLYVRVLIVSVMLAGMYVWCVIFTAVFEELEASNYSSLLILAFVVITGKPAPVCSVS